MRSIVFFDFDGTITTSDTLFEIIRFQKGAMALYTGMALLSPLLVMFKLKMISNQRMKEIVLKYYFNGTPLEQFQQLCNNFCKQRVPQLLRPKAMERIKWHLSQGHEVFIVTASAENWVAPWSETLGIRCLGSRLAIQDGKLTGLLDGKNCTGDEKVCRIKETVQLKDYKDIYAYGDTSGDKAMLSLANHRGYRAFE